MNRYSRRRDPVVPKIQKVELSESNIWLRVIFVGIFIAIAVAAIGYGINSLLPNMQGWQDVQVSKSDTGCQTQYHFQYNFGQGNKSGSQEYREISLTYAEVTDEAYKALDTQSREHVLNLAVLNGNPNTEQVVEPILLDVITRMQAQNSRFLYFGPIYQWYNSLYACTDDSQAVNYDPAHNEAAAEFVAQIAKFASDPASIDLKIAPDGKVTLFVSDEYLLYAKENEITDFLDFGWMKNAFILDALAQRMNELGHTNGTISSYDGFCRTLGGDGYSVNLFERRDNLNVLTAVVSYDGPKSTVSFRGFSMTDMDAQSYYTYQDGTVCGPYVDSDGLLKQPLENLLVLSDTVPCAELAMQMLPAYTSGNPTDGNWTMTQDGQVRQNGTGFAVEKIG